MTMTTILWFIPACFALNMAFGPNNLLAMTNAFRYGVPTAWFASFGRILAFIIMITITALGLGALLVTSEMAFSLLKWAGAAYLVWLGIKLLRAKEPQVALRADPSNRPGMKVLLRQEFYVAIGNPKAILVFTAFFPQFLAKDHYLSSFAIMGALFLVMELVAIAIYALIGSHLGKMAENSRAFAWMNRASGSLMIAFGAMLAFASRPTA